jgi:hypothetical protein
MEEIKNQRENGTKELVSVEKIWHNSFADLLHFRGEPMELLSYLLPIQSIVKRNEIIESLVMKGFQQGTDLARLAKFLKVPINPDFNKLIVINPLILTKSQFIYSVLQKRMLINFRKNGKNGLKRRAQSL